MFFFRCPLSHRLIPGQNCVKAKTQETTFALVRNSLVTYPSVNSSRFHFEQFSHLFQSQIDRHLFGFPDIHTPVLAPSFHEKLNSISSSSIASAARLSFD